MDALYSKGGCNGSKDADHKVVNPGHHVPLSCVGCLCDASNDVQRQYHTQSPEYTARRLLHLQSTFAKFTDACDLV